MPGDLPAADAFGGPVAAGGGANADGRVASAAGLLVAGVGAFVRPWPPALAASAEGVRAAPGTVETFDFGARPSRVGDLPILSFPSADCARLRRMNIVSSCSAKSCEMAVC